MRIFAATLIVLLVLALSVGAGSAQAPGAGSTPAAAPAGWQTVMAEGFEGAWPTTGWVVKDLYPDDGLQRFWGPHNFKPYSGSYSVWPAAGGANWVDPSLNGYPPNLNSRMVYGPFDLGDATAAEVRFWLWTEIEVDYDWLYLGSSGTGGGDGDIFREEGMWEGTLAWSEIVVDLTRYAGDPSVWLRWDFVSDFSNDLPLAGPFIDSITISKSPLAAPVVSIAREGVSDIKLQWPAVTDATSYEVWWGVNNPGFSPRASCADTPTSCKAVTSASYVHTGAGGSPADNYTYIVRAIKAVANGAVRSAFSDRVGEFDFELTR